MDNETFDARRVQKFSADAASPWMEWSGTFLVDVVNEDETPEAKLGAVGFVRAPGGASSSFEFAYDEVLIVTRGSCVVRSGGRALTARDGEVLYLPAGVPGSFHAEEPVEVVYVAPSPYGEVNREIKARLLAEAAQGE